MSDPLADARAAITEATAEEERLKKSQTRVIVSPRVQALTARAQAIALIDIATSLRRLVDLERSKEP